LEAIEFEIRAKNINRRLELQRSAIEHMLQIQLNGILGLHNLGSKNAQTE